VTRFLFVVPPFTGHVNPTVPVAAELVARGHEVAWTGLPGVVEALLPDGAPFLPATSQEVATYVEEMAERPQELRGAAAFKFLQEEVLLPLAGAMVDGVDAAVDAFDADVLVVDQQALAGAVVARRRHMPWATSATTSAELVDPLAALPKVAESMHSLRVDLQVAHGIPEAEAAEGDLRLSPHLVLAYTSELLTGPLPEIPQVRFVGPSTLGRPEQDDFPWDRLDDPDASGARPAILVSLGTLNAEAGERFWTVAADACREQPWQGVFVAPDELVPDPPANVIVRAQVPQLALLRRMAAVVSHGGHNTVCETLAAGLPLVLAPIRDDQPVVADQVVRAGAGVRVKFARVKAPDLTAAIVTAIDDPALRAAARTLQASFAAAGGAAAAATQLESLA
jgi:MGT family glycosyltransferase